MKKKEIIREIAKKTGIEVMQTETVVESFMNTVKEQLINNETIYLRGFGSFQLKKRAAKKARIIRKNLAITIPAHFIPSFKPSKKFRNMVKKRITKV